MHRDPRDVFVSHSFYMQHRATNRLKKYKYQALGIAGSHAQISWFISDWKNSANMVMHYEKLQTAGAQHLAQALSSAGFQVTEEIAGQALNLFQFEKMTGGRDAGQADEKSFFCKGIIGDWKNHLDQEERELFTELLPKTELI